MFLSSFITKLTARIYYREMQETNFTISSAAEMQALGVKIGQQLKGQTVIELVGDVGAGKTTLAKGIAAGMDIKDGVSSPSFTLSRSYQSPIGLRLHHYDFYRLDDIGLLAHQLQESLDDKQGITLIEWAKSATKILPENHVTIKIAAKSENSRLVSISSETNLVEDKK